MTRRLVLVAIAALALAAALAVLPVLLVARRVDLTVLGPAAEVAWGFADPRRVAPAGPTAVGEVLKLAALLKWLLAAALALGRLDPGPGAGDHDAAALARFEELIPMAVAVDLVDRVLGRVALRHPA